MLTRKLRARRLEWIKGGDLGHLSLTRAEKWECSRKRSHSRIHKPFPLRLFSTYSCNEFMQFYTQYSAYQKKSISSKSNESEDDLFLDQRFQKNIPPLGSNRGCSLGHQHQLRISVKNSQLHLRNAFQSTKCSYHSFPL